VDDCNAYLIDAPRGRCWSTVVTTRPTNCSLTRSTRYSPATLPLLADAHEAVETAAEALAGMDSPPSKT